MEAMAALQPKEEKQNRRPARNSNPRYNYFYYTL